MALLPRMLIHDLRSAFKVLDEPLFTPLTRTSHMPYTLAQAWPLTRFNTPTSVVKEEGNAYTVEAEMPGVRKQDLTVEFREGGEVLHISGTRGKTSQHTAGSHQSTTSNEASTTSSVSDAAPAADSAAKSNEPSSASVEQAQVSKTSTLIPAWANESTYSNTFVSQINDSKYRA